MSGEWVDGCSRSLMAPSQVNKATCFAYQLTRPERNKHVPIDFSISYIVNLQPRFVWTHFTYKSYYSGKQSGYMFRDTS